MPLVTSKDMLSISYPMLMHLDMDFRIAKYLARVDVASCIK